MTTTAAVVGEAAPSSAPLLQVSALAVRFGPLRALDGVDLAVRPGELVALAGENGAGKTTLVRCIAADIRPTSREVHFDGRPLSRARLRERGTAILLACHDIDQMFRLADRIAVLRHGRIVADVLPDHVHPDDVAALVAGQQVDSSARRQLNRLHGLADRLASADPSSSLSLILSALGAALGSDRLCIHLLNGDTLVCAASLGLPDALLSASALLPRGPAGGPAGVAAAPRHMEVARGLTVALQALSRGLQADQVALLTQVPGSAPRCRAFVTAAGGQAAAAAPPPALLDAADRLLAIARRDDVASRLQVEGQQFLAVTLAAPAGPPALLAGWENRPPTSDAPALLGASPHPLRLAPRR